MLSYNITIVLLVMWKSLKHSGVHKPPSPQVFQTYTDVGGFLSPLDVYLPCWNVSGYFAPNTDYR